MKITIEIDTAPRGGNYLTADDIEWLKIRQQQKDRERENAPPQDWLDAYRTFFRTLPPE